MANNKIALITGGSRGLGRDMATSLAANGTDIVFTYASNEAAAQETIAAVAAHGRKAVALRLDLAKDSISTFINSFTEALQTNFGTAKFDFLVNNAGMGATVPMADVTEDLFTDFLNVHFKGVYFLTQQCLPLLNDGGRVINISTGTTRFCVPGYSVYASMKGAIEVLTKYIAKENGSRGITANVVAPGPIETDFNSAAIRSNPQMKGFLSGLSPLGRVGNADDIGSVVAFLCSDAAKWVNGQRIEVSGGINV